MSFGYFGYLKVVGLADGVGSMSDFARLQARATSGEPLQGIKTQNGGQDQTRTLLIHVLGIGSVAFVQINNKRLHIRICGD